MMTGSRFPAALKKEKILLRSTNEITESQIFKPFEMFIRMYLDHMMRWIQSIFVALDFLYLYLFGAFGDVGQGLCLFIGGYYIRSRNGI